MADSSSSDTGKAKSASRRSKSTLTSDSSEGTSSVNRKQSTNSKKEKGGRDLGDAPDAKKKKETTQPKKVAKKRKVDDSDESLSQAGSEDHSDRSDEARRTSSKSKKTVPVKKSSHDSRRARSVSHSGSASEEDGGSSGSDSGDHRSHRRHHQQHKNSRDRKRDRHGRRKSRSPSHSRSHSSDESDSRDRRRDSKARSSSKKRNHSPSPPPSTTKKAERDLRTTKEPASSKFAIPTPKGGKNRGASDPSPHQSEEEPQRRSRRVPNYQPSDAAKKSRKTKPKEGYVVYPCDEITVLTYSPTKSDDIYSDIKTSTIKATSLTIASQILNATFQPLLDYLDAAFKDEYFFGQDAMDDSDVVFKNLPVGNQPIKVYSALENLLWDAKKEKLKKAESVVQAALSKVLRSYLVPDDVKAHTAAYESILQPLARLAQDHSFTLAINTPNGVEIIMSRDMLKETLGKTLGEVERSLTYSNRIQRSATWKAAEGSQIPFEMALGEHLFLTSRRNCNEIQDRLAIAKEEERMPVVTVAELRETMEHLKAAGSFLDCEVAAKTIRCIVRAYYVHLNRLAKKKERTADSASGSAHSSAEKDSHAKDGDAANDSDETVDPTESIPDVKPTKKEASGKPSLDRTKSGLASAAAAAAAKKSDEEEEDDEESDPDLKPPASKRTKPNTSSLKKEGDEEEDAENEEDGNAD